MEENEVVESLAALAQPVRLRLYRSLVVAGGEGETPGRMAEVLEVPAATLSFHLKELARAGLISQERDGRNLIYRANYERMNTLLSYLTEHCCQGMACDLSSMPACSPSIPSTPSTPSTPRSKP